MTVTNIPAQVTLSAQPASTQKNFGQMVGEVLQWNPDVSPQMAKTFINNAYRSAVDRRLWYGLLIRGQVTVPSVYNTGTVTTTSGSAIVIGVGTNWDQTMVGRQFRSGFTTGFYNIKSVQSAVQLTLDLPWGSQALAGSGYSIVLCWVSLGNNIKMVKEAVNQRQGYRLITGMPQATLNMYDTWRTSQGWTFMLAHREPSADGQPMFELFPAPTFQQNFPYLAYTQPKNMADDGDYPVAMFRSDILVTKAISDALIFRKNSRYYDPDVAAWKLREYNSELETMSRNDDNLYPQDEVWEYSKFPFSSHGSLWLQQHAGEM